MSAALLEHIAATSFKLRSFNDFAAAAVSNTSSRTTPSCLDCRIDVKRHRRLNALDVDLRCLGG